jgi:ketosteroid isomerase-like protein
MSRANVELVHRAGEAFNRHDAEALAAISDDDLEFVPALTSLDTGGVPYRGPEAWAAYFARMDETWDGWRLEDLEVFDGGGDRVAARFRLVGNGKGSGVPVRHLVGLAYRMRQGKLWRVRSYLDPNEALEAVGLAE